NGIDNLNSSFKAVFPLTLWLKRKCNDIIAIHFYSVQYFVFIKSKGCIARRTNKLFVEKRNVVIVWVNGQVYLTKVLRHTVHHVLVPHHFYLCGFYQLFAFL